MPEMAARSLRLCLPPRKIPREARLLQEALSSGVTLAARAQAENTTVSAQASENQGNATGKEIKSPNTTQPDTSNRASLLYILLVAGVMIVVVNLIVSYAKKKMEEEAKVAQEKSGSEPLNPKS